MTTKKLGIVGCGDFLRCEADPLIQSNSIKVHSLYDPDANRSAKYAEILGGQVAASSEEIFQNPEIDLVALFVPPWARKDLFEKAAGHGKHIITTKPFAPTLEDCRSMEKAALENSIRAAVIYGRTEDPFMETARKLFNEGRFGKLALYKQDWLHAYPKWNKWATQPDKNGGPFMDAMIHNLNAACYLMDGPVSKTTFFSARLAHPDMECADTESMVVEFEGGTMANLFITWAADLATFETDGNFREHIDLFYMITDKGWRLTKETRSDKTCLVASREGVEEVIECQPIEVTPFDAMVEYIASGQRHGSLASLADASRDIELIRSS